MTHAISYVQWRQKRVLDGMELEFQVVMGYLVSALETEVGLVQEQQVLLTPEPSLQPYHNL